MRYSCPQTQSASPDKDSPTLPWADGSHHRHHMDHKLRRFACPCDQLCAPSLLGTEEYDREDARDDEHRVGAGQDVDLDLLRATGAALPARDRRLGLLVAAREDVQVHVPLVAFDD